MESTPSRPSGVDRVLRLLVVDDEAPVRIMLLDVLRSLGYDVSVATGGDDALRLFGEGDYDLVMTDLVMPGMDGWELATRLRRAAPHLPIVMLTGTAPDVDLEVVRRERITLVHKPVSVSRLHTILQDLLAGGR